VARQIKNSLATSAIHTTPIVDDKYFSVRMLAIKIDEVTKRRNYIKNLEIHSHERIHYENFLLPLTHFKSSKANILQASFKIIS
jgi:hypothetical protein